MADDIDILVGEIEDSLNNFNNSIVSVQNDVLRKIEMFIKELTLRDGNIQANVSNLRRLSRLRVAIEKAILSPVYKAKLKEFTKSFNTVTQIQDGYFAGLVDNYTTKAVYDEVKNLAIKDTVDKLTERGLSNVVNGVTDILKNNITSKSSYPELLKQVKNYLTNDKTGDGALVKYAKQITTDSLNQYSANYTKLVTDDLGLEWFGYSGSLVNNSRELCKKLVQKRFIHKSELPDIIKGIINGVQIPLNPKTKLPMGMIAGTTANNFQVLRGGYQCNHQLIPISKFRVPKEKRKEFEEA